jgi:hypothetical protein
LISAKSDQAANGVKWSKMAAKPPVVMVIVFQLGVTHIDAWPIRETTHILRLSFSSGESWAVEPREETFRKAGPESYYQGPLLVSEDSIGSRKFRWYSTS